MGVFWYLIMWDDATGAVRTQGTLLEGQAGREYFFPVEDLVRLAVEAAEREGRT